MYTAWHIIILSAQSCVTIYVVMSTSKHSKFVNQYFEFLGLKMLQKDVHGKKVQTMAMMLMKSYQRVRKVGELFTRQFLFPAGSNNRSSSLITKCFF